MEYSMVKLFTKLLTNPLDISNAITTGSVNSSSTYWPIKSSLSGLLHHTEVPAASIKFVAGLTPSYSLVLLTLASGSSSRFSEMKLCALVGHTA